MRSFTGLPMLRSNPSGGQRRIARTQTPLARPRVRCGFGHVVESGGLTGWATAKMPLPTLGMFQLIEIGSRRTEPCDRVQLAAGAAGFGAGFGAAAAALAAASALALRSLRGRARSGLLRTGRL